jgi:hypothetical protein
MQDIKSMKEKNGPTSPVQCRAHHPVRQVSGYPRCHWTPPSGEYLPRIAPVDAMVIDFGVKNRIVALWKSLSEASFQKA